MRNNDFGALNKNHKSDVIGAIVKSLSLAYLEMISNSPKISCVMLQAID